MRAVRSGMPATGIPRGANWTDRWSFSPWASSAASPKWGTTATSDTSPRPTVRPPPRASTMGSVSTMAAADDAATTAPDRQAATRASQTAEPFRVLRRCMGDPPARYTNRAEASTPAAPASSASARDRTMRPSTEAPSVSNQAPARATRRSGCS